MKKLLSLFAIGMLVIAGCQSVDTDDTTSSVSEEIQDDSSIAPDEEVAEEETQDYFSVMPGAEVTECELTLANEIFAGSEIEDMHPDQITGCFAIDDMIFAFVSQPNTWTALTGVREWEAEGHEAWSGLLYSDDGNLFEVFLKISNEDYNPVGFYLQEEALVLDTADDEGAGSGEGNLLRFVYPFAGGADELLYQWAAESCTGYYIPETYSVEDGSCAG